MVGFVKSSVYLPLSETVLRGLAAHFKDQPFYKGGGGTQNIFTKVRFSPILAFIRENIKEGDGSIL